MDEFGMGFDNSNDDYGKLSKINSAGLVNSTLSNLWQDFFRHFRHGQYLSANSDLDCIWTILGGEKKVLTDNTEKDYLKIEEELSDIGILRDSLEIKGFNKVSDSQLKLLAQQKAKLLKKSLFLRRLQNSQGKGTAYSDDDEGDFD